MKPIKTEADYEAGLAEIERLWSAVPHTPEGDLLDVWVTLVEAYEEKHYPIAPPDPIEAILHTMENKGWSVEDVETEIGVRGQLGEVLNRQRPLSLTMIRHLQNGLNISADILIKPYPLQPA